MPTIYPLIRLLARQLQRPILKARLLPVLVLGLVAVNLWLGPSHPLSQLNVLVQYGLLLIWQPLFDPDQPLRPRAMLGLLATGLVMALLASFAQLYIWLALLAALFGGRALTSRKSWDRRFHLGLLASALYLLWLQLIPLARGLSPPFAPYDRYLLLGLLALLPVCPVAAHPNARRAAIDFLFAVLVLLMAMLVGLGALAMQVLLLRPYAEALAVVLVGLGVGLWGLAWLWNPRLGFAGIGALLSMRMLQLGMPFERWSMQLLRAFEAQPSLTGFLKVGATDLLELPGVNQINWRYGRDAGVVGEAGGQSLLLAEDGLELQLWLEYPILPGLVAQMQLATRLLALLCRARQREQELADRAYIDAVHETGARITHDIKNLLQALHTTLYAAQQAADPAQVAALYARQMPEISRRLELSLARLQAPQLVPAIRKVAARDWWERQCRRYIDTGVEFETQGDWATGGGQVLDEELFCSALDHLLGNALHKRLAQPGLGIVASLDVRAGVALRVWDQGEPFKAELLPQLFEHPLPSESGFGLGLYQLQQVARVRGYCLQLTQNDAQGVALQLSAKQAV